MNNMTKMFVFFQKRMKYIDTSSVKNNATKYKNNSS